MARRRMISPGLWRHERFLGLSMQARLLFVGLISHADDEGRGRAHPLAIKASVFPADNVTPDLIQAWLSELVQARFAQLYGNDEFYILPGWKEHQRVSHPTPSTLPAPEEFRKAPESFRRPA